MELWPGDCLNEMARIADGSVDLILCDLPYAVTQNKWDALIPFDALWGHYRRVLKSNGVVVLTATQPFASSLILSNPEWFRYEWIWAKTAGTGHLNAPIQPLRAHENVLVFYGQQPTYNPQMTLGRPYAQRSGRASSNYGKQVSALTINHGTRYPVTVIECARDNEREHPTQKPVALMEYLIRTYTRKGELVLDNCMGSGTTGVACVNTGREFIGIEKDAGYFAIAKERIEKALATPREFPMFGEAA